MPDEVIEQAIMTRSAARKARNSSETDKQVRMQDDQVINNDHINDNNDDDDNDHLLGTSLNLDTSIASVTDRTKLIKLQKSDSNLLKIRQQCSDNPPILENSYFYLQEDMLMHHFLIGNQISLQIE